MKNKMRGPSLLYKPLDKNFLNSKEFLLLIEHMYDTEFQEVSNNILNLSKKEFFNNIMTRIINILIEKYNNEIIESEKLASILYSYDKQYEQKYNNYLEELTDFMEQYKNCRNRDKYITNFRKHCSKTDNYAIHNCGQKNKKGFFFPIYNQSNIKYVICIECHKSFLCNKFLNYCNHCGIDYYSNILNKNENINLLPATWESYHCRYIINQKINCPNCSNIFYIDTKYNILKCLKCKNYKSPNNIEKVCSICNSKYSSNILIYNPLEKDYLNVLINNALISKNRAKPSKILCCNNINMSTIKFYHNNSCRGILYFIKFKKNLIIVCEKCHQLYLYDKFTWTCPSCGKEFKEEKLYSKDLVQSPKDSIEISKKNYLNEKNNK